MDGQICPKGHCLDYEALPSDAKQLPEGQICPSVPNTNDRFFFLHIFVPTLELFTILP